MDIRTFLNAWRLVIVVLFQLLLLFCESQLLAETDSPFEMKELWLGEFSQSAPMSWRGEMRLYIRYNSHDPSPRKVEGVVVWPGLGETKTIVEGTHSMESISFVEERCGESSCNQVVLGGRYNGKFDALYTILEGQASIAGFKGKFRLKRVIAPE